MIRRRDIILGATAATLAASGGVWFYHRKKSLTVPQSLLVAGSASMHPLNTALAERFAKKHPEIGTVVQAGGSLAGLLAVKRGTIDVAAMSRDLTEEEDTPQARNYLIGVNEVSIVVNPASHISNLDASQLRAVFTGQVTNWHDVGGPNAAIHLVSRTEGASSLRYLEEEILDGEEVAVTARALTNAQQVGEVVAEDRHAIGFLAMSEQVHAKVRTLSIDGVPPERATILSGRYPLVQPLYLVLYGNSSKAAREFVDFARGPEGQAIVKAHGLTAVG